MLLHDVVGRGVVLAHVVAVDQVDLALLAARRQQVRVGGAMPTESGRISRAAGAEVGVGAVRARAR